MRNLQSLCCLLVLNFVKVYCTSEAIRDSKGGYRVGPPASFTKKNLRLSLLAVRQLPVLPSMAVICIGSLNVEAPRCVYSLIDFFSATCILP